MKKIIISALLSTVIFGVSAMTPRISADDEALLFGYCGNYASSMGTEDTNITTVSAAIEIPADLAQSWKGATLERVNIGYGVSSSNDVTVFITQDLDGDPLYNQDATMTVKRGWNVVELDTPFAIDGTPFYVGYSTKVASVTDKPIGIDDIKTSNPYGDLINNYGEWENIGKFFGSVCIQLALTGDNLPQNEVDATGAEIPGLIQSGDTFSAKLYFTNNGLKNVNSLTVETSVGGVEMNPVEVSFSADPIESGQDGVVEIDNLICEATGKDIPVVFTITKVNGVANEAVISNTETLTLACAEQCFYQNILVEEFTGIWCPACPRGIVSMAYMEENYTDKGFIGIAVHYGDPMQANSYSELADPFTASPGFPYATMNRRFYFDPFPENMLEFWDKIYGSYAPAQVEISVDYDEDNNTLEATGVAQFAFDDNGNDYSLAFVITQNDVGPYPQLNAYAGTDEEMGGWQDLPGTVPTIYNEVARDIKNVFGIKGSIPAEVKALTPYSYTTSLPLDNVTDIENCDFIVMLLNNETGEVINSAKVSFDGNSGIRSLTEDKDGIYKAYNLQGVKVLETKDSQQVNSLPQGIYVVNGKKVYVK